MKILLTGLTGFKGMWFAALLNQLGHKVHGISLPDKFEKSYFETVFPTQEITHETLDIRNFLKLKASIERYCPEFLIHFAAASVVSSETIENVTLNVSTNSIGTINVLLASEGCPSLRGRIVATTDKVYESSSISLTEESRLLGHEPYSKSKVLADRISSAWAENFPQIPTSIVRAGNVIGGGDFKKSRLVPDIYFSIKEGTPLFLRNPNQTRPWQYILDCLNGYYAIMRNMIDSGVSGVWNIGPAKPSEINVGQFVDYFLAEFGAAKLALPSKEIEQVRESKQILLDSSKLKRDFGVGSSMSVVEAINNTSSWYRSYHQGVNPRKLMIHEIKNFFGLIG